MGVALHYLEALITLVMGAGVLQFAFQTILVEARSRSPSTMTILYGVYASCWSVVSSLVQLYALHDTSLVDADVGLTFGLPTFLVAFSSFGLRIHPLWYVACMLGPTVQVVAY